MLLRLYVLPDRGETAGFVRGEIGSVARWRGFSYASVSPFLPRDLDLLVTGQEGGKI
jgi:hypothetical protein